MYVKRLGVPRGGLYALRRLEMGVPPPLGFPIASSPLPIWGGRGFKHPTTSPIKTREDGWGARALTKTLFSSKKKVSALKT